MRIWLAPLVRRIIEGSGRLSDDELSAILDAEPDPGRQKAWATTLYSDRLIDRDQIAFTFYRLDLKDA